MEQKGGMGHLRCADRPAGYRGTSSSDPTLEAPRSPSTDPLRREDPAERERGLYDLNGESEYLG